VQAVSILMVLKSVHFCRCCL